MARKSHGGVSKGGLRKREERKKKKIITCWSEGESMEKTGTKIKKQRKSYDWKGGREKFQKEREREFDKEGDG